MSRPSKRTFLERLSDGPVIGAEGYVFELERRGYIKAGPYVPEVILDEPDALRQLHREFLRAGADVMVALTYYAHRKKLKDVGREGQLEELNRQAVRIANEIAAEGGALVAGNICNTWSYDPADPKRSGEVVREQYREQLGWAVEEGIDLVIAETNDFVGEALIGLEVCQEFGLPALVTFASVQPEKTYDDYLYVDACKVLADAGAAVVGLNCSRGPATMMPLLEQIRAAVDIPIAAQPVPYRTNAAAPAFESLAYPDGRRAFPIELEPFAHTRFEMADFARQAADLGAGYIGICCGGSPHYVRAMAEALGRQTPASRYSPALDLHPVLGTPQNTSAQAVMGDWSHRTDQLTARRPKRSVPLPASTFHVPVHRPGICHGSQVPELVRIHDRADRLDLSVEHVERHGADDLAVPIAEDRTGLAIQLAGLHSCVDAGEGREIHGEHAGDIVGAEHGPGQRGCFASTVTDQLDIGGEQLGQSVDIAVPECLKEPRRQLIPFPAIGLEPRTPDAHVPPRSHHQLSARRLGPANGTGNLIEPEPEHLPEHKHRPFQRGQPFEQQQDRHGHRIRQLRRPRRVRIRVGEQRLREPLPDVLLAPDPRRAQHIDRNPSDHGGEEGPGRCGLGRGGLVSHPGLLDRVLRLGHTAQDSVGDREQQRSQLLELLDPAQPSSSLKP